MRNCKPLQNNAAGKRAYRNAKHVKGLYSFATVGAAHVALKLSQQIQRLDSRLVVSIVACCNPRRSQERLLGREPWLPFSFLPLLLGEGRRNPPPFEVTNEEGEKCASYDSQCCYVEDTFHVVIVTHKERRIYHEEDRACSPTCGD